MVRWFALAALVFIAAGVFVGFLPLTEQGVNCGSVYHPAEITSADATTLLATQVVQQEQDACQAHRDTIGRVVGLGWVLGLGSLVIGAGVRMRQHKA